MLRLGNAKEHEATVFHSLWISSPTNDGTPRCQRREETASGSVGGGGDVRPEGGDPPFVASVSEPLRREVTAGAAVRLQCSARSRFQVGCMMKIIV